MDHPPGGRIGLAVGPVIVGALVVRLRWVWPVRRIRIAVPILLATVVLLLASPTFFPHYVGAVAVPAALVLGGAVDRVRRWSAFQDVIRIGLAVVGGIILVLDLVSLSVIQSGDSVPAAKLGTVVQPAAGCITADDPERPAGLEASLAGTHYESVSW